MLYHLRKLGIDTTKNGKYRPKINNSRLQQIVKIYQNTGSILETAKQTNLHPSSIHYRLTKMGIVKKNRINQQIAKKKYELLTDILTQLFKKMSYDIRYVQIKYNGHGPDMIIENNQESMIIEHKATIKRSSYWEHAIEEAKSNMKKYNIQNALIITTAKKPKKFKNQEIKIIFLDELKKLLEKNNLNNLVSKVEQISSTPCI